jgi:hypothetical protein
MKQGTICIAVFSDRSQAKVRMPQKTAIQIVQSAAAFSNYNQILLVKREFFFQPPHIIANFFIQDFSIMLGGLEVPMTEHLAHRFDWNSVA